MTENNNVDICEYNWAIGYFRKKYPPNNDSHAFNETLIPKDFGTDHKLSVLIKQYNSLSNEPKRELKALVQSIIKENQINLVD